LKRFPLAAQPSLSIFALSLILAINAISCRSDDQASEANVIVGKNDLQFYLNDNQWSKAIGRMMYGCTVTHIGNGYVITAGHCVSNRDDCSTNDDFLVRWADLIGRPEPAKEELSRCIEVIAVEQTALKDYAILRYDNVPDESLRVNLAGDVEYGDQLTILSHPLNQPLSTSGPCQSLGNYKGSNMLSYDCDTQGGSSGAAVLNERMEVVAIHSIGSNFYEANAGTDVKRILVWDLVEGVEFIRKKD
jgi:V8-like Glu-specific endopeptidase